MSDKIQDDAKRIDDEKVSFGERLKSARENMGLTIQEAAASLHLRPRFVSMLENENLAQSSLPPIYLRGYLRAYSKLLNIPEKYLDPLLEKLNPKPVILLNPPPLASDSLFFSFPLENNIYYARIATFFISLALLTSITAWWYLHSTTTAHTEIAQQQVKKNPEFTTRTTAEASQEPSLPAVKNVLETVAKSPPIEEHPAASITPAAKKPVALASTATKENRHNLAVKSLSQQVYDDGDSSDE